MSVIFKIRKVSSVFLSCFLALLFTSTDRIDENLKSSLQVDLDKMTPGLHVQVGPMT